MLVKKRLVFIVILTIFLTLQLTLVNKSLAEGNTLYVDDSGGVEYLTIQEAIDDAISGDMVYVFSGTYSENLIITKNLILSGQNKDNTIIDGGNNGHVIRAYGTVGTKIDIQISGFYIKNAGGTGNDCIALSYVNDAEISNNNIYDSQLSDGIQLDHCNNVEIKNNEINGNAGAGISLTLTSNCIISENNINDNQKGIYVYLSSNDNEIKDNNIYLNSQYGIQIVQSTNNKIYINDFANNGENSYDSLTNNWYYNNQGNYWDDYSGQDLDEDGIGDTPHNINGGSNQDLYPLGYFGPTSQILSISPNPANEGVSISFNGNGADSDGTIVEWEWTSSIDGIISSSGDFSSSSLNPGTHTIKFRVKDDNGRWSSYDEATLTINTEVIISNIKPVATIISIEPSSAFKGDAITFLGHGSDEDGEITDYIWISDIDGTIADTYSFEIDSLSVGTHTIEFKVKDDDNEWSEGDTLTIEVKQKESDNPSSNQNPVAIAGDSYSGSVYEDIEFDGTDSYDPDGEIVEYYWDFGDGATDTGSKITHMYTISDTYTVTLRVKDNNKDIDTDLTSVTISEISDQNNPSESKSEFKLEVPFSVVVVFELIIVLSIISLFFIWIKRK